MARTFSLRTLLLASSVTGLAGCAYIYGSDFWIVGSLIAAPALILAAIVNAAIRPGPSRLYWGTFALVAGLLTTLTSASPARLAPLRPLTDKLAYLTYRALPFDHTNCFPPQLVAIEVVFAAAACLLAGVLFAELAKRLVQPDCALRMAVLLLILSPVAVVFIPPYLSVWARNYYNWQYLSSRGAQFRMFKVPLPYGTYTRPLPRFWTALGASALDQDLELPEVSFSQSEIARIRALYPEVDVRSIPAK